MNYKFIDIGCGHQSVSSDIFGTEVFGMYVEPIKEYLDVLPEGKNIIKENCAISNENGKQKFNAVIVKNPEYFTNKEISRIVHEQGNDFHKYINKYHESGQSSFSAELSTSNIVEVNTLTLEKLFSKHNVTSIDFLKIDVEGHEETILRQLLNLMAKNKVKINNEIKFEYNNLSDLKTLDFLSDFICNLFGFEKEFKHSAPWNEDIILTKK